MKHLFAAVLAAVSGGINMYLVQYLQYPAYLGPKHDPRVSSAINFILARLAGIFSSLFFVLFPTSYIS